MAILQALLALITKSAGKVLNAIFGWAVHALFGKTASRDQTMLSALVGAAVAWPLLVAGIAAPKVAAFALALVPLPHSVPAWIVRLVWFVLALAVPLTLGPAIAARRPEHAPAEPLAARVLRGFPLTLGLALAFLVMFVSVPVMRLVALARRQKSADVPLVTDAAAYHEVAARVVEALNRHGFGLRPAEPGWWVKAPTRILAWFGGASFAGLVPTRLEHYVATDLELSFYASGALLRGARGRTSWAQGLIAETAVHSRALETFEPAAQDVERQIRRLWALFDEAPAEHRGAPRLLARTTELARDLARLEVDYDQWQVLYRQLLQVERAVRGERQLLDEAAGAASGGEVSMSTISNKRPSDPSLTTRPPQTTFSHGGAPPPPPTSSLSTPDLLRAIKDDAEALVEAQLELAKAELRADLAAGSRMAAALGVAAVAALLTLNLLLVTAILALAAVMPAWGAGLAVSGAALAVAAVAGAIGWTGRVRRPLARTRHELEEDVKWTKERVV